MNTTLFEMEFSVPSPLVIEDVITFNSNHKKNTKEFVDSFSKLVGNPIELVTKRITNFGYHLRRYPNHTLIGITETGLRLKDKTVLNSSEEDDPTIFLNFNNLLGEIPILPKYTHSELWDVGESFLKLKKQYDDFYHITQLKNFNSVGIQLEYQYISSDSFSKFPYLIKGNLKKINLSNVEIFHLLTWGGELKNHTSFSYVDMVPRNDVVRFLGPDRALKKIKIFDHRLVVNPYDEE
jgi:hypothetical protein